MGAANFVAMMTSCRRAPSARPSISSEAPRPYTSAVSNNVMPASSAAFVTFSAAS